MIQYGLAENCSLLGSCKEGCLVFIHWEDASSMSDDIKDGTDLKVGEGSGWKPGWRAKCKRAVGSNKDINVGEADIIVLFEAGIGKSLWGEGEGRGLYNTYLSQAISKPVTL